MKLPQHVVNILLIADSKVLATTGPHGLNAVPVSTLQIKDDKIWLINYFFKKTLENILTNPAVTLVAWKGFEGFQIRAQVSYHESGTEFEEAKGWVAERLPERVVKGLLVLTPEVIYDVSPTA